jgi:hypothetical protein
MGAGAAGLAPVIPKLNFTGAAGAGTGVEAAGLGDGIAPRRAPPTGAAGLPPNADTGAGLEEGIFPVETPPTGATARPINTLPLANGLPAAIDEVFVGGNEAAAGCFGGNENEPLVEAVAGSDFFSSCLFTGAEPNENFWAVGFDGAAAMAGAVGVGFAADESKENPEDAGGAGGLPSPSNVDWPTGLGELDGATENNEGGFADSGAGAADDVVGLPKRGLVAEGVAEGAGADTLGGPKLKEPMAAGAGVAALLLDSSGLLEGNEKSEPPDTLLSSGFVNVIAGTAEFFASSSFFWC